MSLPSRLAARAASTARGALRRGSSVECTCCGGWFAEFLPYNDRPGVLCPRCGSQERHRALALYLADELDLGSTPASVLHFAPEAPIARRLAAVRGLDYTRADLVPAPGVEAMDITAIPRADASFDLVLVNHVLEHVPDDRAALAEVHRVLRPGGRLLTMHPVDETRAETFEDPSVAEPDDRRREFGQADHVRVYGRDFPPRLAAAGFEVEVVRYSEERVSEEARRRHGLVEQWGPRPSAIYVCDRLYTPNVP